MKFTEIISESSKICPQCGMKGCTCAPGKCNCKPKPGYPKKMDEAANPAQQAAIAKKKKQGVAEAERQPGSFSGAWQILVNGKKVHSFRGNFDQETADRVGVVKAASRGLYNPGSGDKIKIVPVMLAQQGVAEGSENLSIGQQMAKDGITYSPEKENELIGLMSQYMKKAGMSSKAIRYYLSYDEDFIPDQLSELPRQGVAEGETWSKHNNPRAGGMSKKSVASYRRSHPGSKIQTAVTKKPSKIKKGSKDAKRRASFCARMRGMKKHRTSAKTARDPNSNINKSLRRWNCESIEQMQELVMLAEQKIKALKK